MNSFKMKISVIFGVANMLLGTTMKGFNAIHKKDWVELICECFTQILLMCALFGFMDYMIVTKWLTNWYVVESDENRAPGIITLMIIMFI